ncbi:hypothetical protein D4T05_17140 [Salmonella enterica]|nr:hypothetical protein [Salmonella enterica]ECE6807497.1 hypothetical protein [Salmonella enterica subsp. diarizonae]ECT8550213.1 hypothetical protein [Salmonella enterica subsp. diarizonae serovar 48:i:z]EAM2673084.1 hypothetical protein [Salmonella enterica]EAP0945601.1 hypothetical protein [Salmonella enterica]
MEYLNEKTTFQNRDKKKIQGRQVCYLSGGRECFFDCSAYRYCLVNNPDYVDVTPQQEDSCTAGSKESGYGKKT